MSWVCEQSNRQHQLVPREIAEEAIKAAAEAKQKEDMDDDDDDH